MHGYNHKDIEKKWQEKWTVDGLYETLDTVEGKENEYILVEFPYPSGDLHVGHWYAFAVSDIYARLRSAQGKNVMFPIGYDAFGLPAENAAIKRGINPRTWTEKNMETMSEQFSLMGAMFDPRRKLATCDPDYYKWTQYLFTEFFKNDLAYQADTIVNWCPSCKTVLANEQVTEGKCERCDSEVEHKNMKQWMMRITNYAEPLIDDLNDLDWPQQIKEAQKNWIGKSQGVEFVCTIKDLDIEVKMYNSVPQTFMAETFTTIAPDHPLVKELIAGTDQEEAVLEYLQEIKEKKAKDKFSLDKETKGVFTGRYIENFCNTGKDLPIWVAPYVILDYGTGIVNASAHDERDFAFAKENNIPLHPVMFPEDKTEAEKVRNQEYAYCRDPKGIIQEPEVFKGRQWQEAREDIIEYLIENKFAERKINYKLRDWGVSRQRYWGCPIPIIHCDSCGAVPAPKEDLPVVLPDVEDYLPNDEGRSPLSKAPDWVNTQCPECGKDAKRETDTLDTFVDSSWYFLRYADPKNQDTFADPKKVKQWLPVDFYSGGAEHTTMHLLYSRFFVKAMTSCGLIDMKEPFTQRLNRGLILGPDGNKMSKSKGNVINPDEIVELLGADTVRLYLAFIGPYNEPGNYPWDPNGVVGVRRFLERVWRVSESLLDTDGEGTEKALHQMIDKVTNDAGRLKFNTAISAMMTFITHVERNGISQASYETFLKVLSVFAPHITEELYHNLGNPESIHLNAWPEIDTALLAEDTVVIGIQVNGKRRAEYEFAVGATQKDVEKIIAQEGENITNHLKNFEIARIIYVPGKIVNIVGKTLDN